MAGGSGVQGGQSPAYSSGKRPIFRDSDSDDDMPELRSISRETGWATSDNSSRASSSSDDSGYKRSKTGGLASGLARRANAMDGAALSSTAPSFPSPYFLGLSFDVPSSTAPSFPRPHPRSSFSGPSFDASSRVKVSALADAEGSSEDELASFSDDNDGSTDRIKGVHPGVGQRVDDAFAAELSEKFEATFKTLGIGIPRPIPRPMIDS